MFNQPFLYVFGIIVCVGGITFTQRKKYIIVGRRYNKSKIFAVALCSAFGSISVAMFGTFESFDDDWKTSSRQYSIRVVC